jgi:hypothetical protein
MVLRRSGLDIGSGARQVAEGHEGPYWLRRWRVCALADLSARNKAAARPTFVAAAVRFRVQHPRKIGGYEDATNAAVAGGCK